MAECNARFRDHTRGLFERHASGAPASSPTCSSRSPVRAGGVLTPLEQLPTVDHVGEGVQAGEVVLGLHARRVSRCHAST